MTGSLLRFGIEQINQPVSLMDEATQQNAALVEQASAAAASLARQTVELKQRISFFKVRPHAKSLRSA